MFAKNNDKKESANSKTVNLFAEGTVMQGEIKTENDIRIDGIISGTVVSKSKVVIGPTGKVTGDIVCQSADISGTLIGSIENREQLFLKATAVIDGDITTDKMIVEAGARFNGKCSMGKPAETKLNVATPTPQFKKETV